MSGGASGGKHDIHGGNTSGCKIGTMAGPGTGGGCLVGGRGGRTILGASFISGR